MNLAAGAALHIGSLDPQPDNECCTFAWFTGHRDAIALALQQAIADGQSQPAAGLFARSKKGIKNPQQYLGRNACTGI